MVLVLLADFKFSFVSSIVRLSLGTLHFLVLFPFVAYESYIPYQEASMFSALVPLYFETCF